MVVFFVGVGLFAVALIVRYAVGRVRALRAQLISFAPILFVVLVSGLRLMALPIGATLRGRVPILCFDLALQLYATLGFSYLLFLDFIRRRITTGTLISKIEDSGQSGIDREGLLQTVAARLAAGRLELLEDEELVSEQAGKFGLARLGHIAVAWRPATPKLRPHGPLPAAKRKHQAA